MTAPSAVLAASPFDTFLGLPVHALVVHVVVVLLPLTAIGAILIAARNDWSKRFGIVVVVLAFVATGAAFVSKESGEKLAARVGLPQEHAELGDVMPWVALGFFVVVTVFWLFDRGVPGGRRRPGWLRAFAVAVVLVSLFAIYWTFQVGHTGAEAVWNPILQRTTPAGAG